MSNTKKVIDLKSAMPTLPVLVEGTSTLAQAYEAACMADAVSEKVRGTVSGVFGVLRHKVVQLYTTELAKVSGDVDKLDTSTVIGDFLLACQEAEAAYDSAGLPADMSKSSWTNAKSQIKSALEKGYNFADNREVGQSALQKWSRDIRKAEQEAEESAKIQEAQERKSANDPSKEPIHSDKTNVEHSVFDGVIGGSSDTEDLSEDVQEYIRETLLKLQEVAKIKGEVKVIKMLSNLNTQCDQAIQSAMVKLASGGN